MAADRNGLSGHEMGLIVSFSSTAQKIEDLMDKKIAFTPQTSNSGDKMAFSGKHDSSIVGVGNNDCDLVAVLNAMVDSSNVHCIDKVQSFPTTKKVKQAFISSAKAWTAQGFGNAKPSFPSLTQNTGRWCTRSASSH
jgi:ABC-type phosphate/phosphonate transport system substrate-binding protein